MTLVTAGKHRSIAGHMDPDVRSALTGKPCQVLMTLKLKIPGWPGNGMTRGTVCLNPKMSRHHQVGKFGGAAASGIAGWPLSATGLKVEAALYAATNMCWLDLTTLHPKIRRLQKSGMMRRTRNGRHGHLYTNFGKINLFNKKYETDSSPIEEGCGCPVCADLQVVVGFNDLASKNKQLAEEWDAEKNAPLTPECVTCASERKVWWRCSLGHSWKASVGNRAHGSGCPICTGKQVLAGFNDLASQNPSISEEWDREKNKLLTPKDVTTNSGRRVWWRCAAHGHSWMASVNNRANGTQCPICSGHQVLAGFNDLETQNPALAGEWDTEKNAPLTPRDVTPYAKNRVWWRCATFGHSWEASVGHRSRGINCPICANRTIIPGFNDLASISPQLIQSWDFDRNTISPSEIPPRFGGSVKTDTIGAAL